MSELQNKQENRESAHWQLLATVSVLTLLGSLYATAEARAADTEVDRPQLWIELGGQLSRFDSGHEVFSPPLMADRPSIFSSSTPLEKAPLYSIDEYGKVEFQPRTTDWSFQASVLYGRSSRSEDYRQQTHPVPYVNHIGTYVIGTVFPTGAKFADTNVQSRESHLILDFQAGKDVGLGLFGGKNSLSVVNFGVRFAQFNTRSNFSLKSDPDWHQYYVSFYGIKVARTRQGVYHSRVADLQAARNFRGIGPSVSWNASAAIVGNSDQGEIAVDWGVDAVVLFGRQKAIAHHQTIGKNRPAPEGVYYHHGYITYQTSAAHARSRSVIVPNVGGFAGLSVVYPNVKFSAGYRADFFFGAMDGGIDVRSTKNVSFHGPFATISLGLGG